MEGLDLLTRFGVALTIGLLVGMQREFSQGGNRRLFAGVRTFPLLALTGTTGAMLAEQAGSPLVLVCVLAVLAALMVPAYRAGLKQGNVGITTEVAALLTVLTGALCYYAQYQVAAALAVVSTALLTLKLEMHGFVEHLVRGDLLAVLKFALITAVILPLLPRSGLSTPPLDVITPFGVWLMVVFVSGISFLGYVLIKVLGPRQGLLLSGLLGGLVSSTALTASMAQRSREETGLAVPMAMAIATSWTTMFLRVLVVVGILHWPLVGRLWAPLAASAAVGLGYALLALRRRAPGPGSEVTYDNPFQLRPALTFGLLYALVRVGAAAAQMWLGTTGVYLSSAAAGLVELNAISLSLARMAATGSVGLSLAARGLVLATIANTLVKGGIVGMRGAPELRRALLPVLALMVATAGAVGLLVS
jgi:uncharacterized membrane protein (DUF4010 family)